MSWNKVKGADGYAIYRAGSKNGSYKYLKSVTTNKASHAGLKAGSKYYYKVRLAVYDENGVLTGKSNSYTFTCTVNVKMEKSNIKRFPFLNKQKILSIGINL